MKVGITGTRKGWNRAQRMTFERWLADFENEIDEFHHGDCVGVDHQAAETVEKMFGREIIHCHPPKAPTHRAFFGGAVMMPKENYLQRNQNIVDAVDLLITIPWGYTQQLRSGTWATWRYAHKTGNTATIVITPSGTIQ